MKDKKNNIIIQYFKDTSEVYTSQFGSKISRSLHLTSAAASANTIIALSKLFIGVLSLSFFACANAFFTLGMIIAKVIALTGIRKAKSKEEQYKYYFLTGIVQILSCILYIIYSIWLFYNPVSNSYHEYIAIGIAAVTFTEIGLNIRGVIVTKQNHTLLVYAIKMTNLSASLIALVLTQTALLSFTGTVMNATEASKANGFIGIMMGTIAAIIGVFMILRGKRMRKAGLCHKLKE